MTYFISSFKVINVMIPEQELLWNGWTGCCCCCCSNEHYVIKSFIHKKDFNTVVWFKSLTLFGIKTKSPLHPVPPVTSTNVGISQQKFLTFSLNPFAILV